MDNDLSVLLKVILDSSGIGSGDISKIQKILEKYTVNVAAELDKTQLMNSVKQVLPQVIKEISKISGKDIKIDIDDSLIEKSINQVIQDGQRLEKELTATTQRINEIQRLSNGGIKNDYATQLAVLEGRFSRLGFKESEIAEKTEKVNVAFNDLKQRLSQPFDESNFQEIINLNDKLQKELIESQNELTRLGASIKMATDSSRLNAVNQMQKWADNNGKAMKRWGTEINGFISQMGNLSNPLTKLDLDDILREFKKIQVEAIRTGNVGMTTSEKFKNAWNKIGGWSLVTSAFVKIGQVGRKMYDAVVKVNSAMVELTKVSDASSSDITKYFDEAADSAKRYGSTVSDMINATADWSRLGYNLPDAKKLAEIATLYTNVGDGIDMSTANESLISTLQGFKMTADEAIHVIDAFNEVANTEAINSAGIGEALQRSASSMYAAGNTLEETIGLVTAANAVVQDPDSIGTAYKTISMRIRGAKTEMEELGLETDGMVESTATLQEEIMALSGVDIMKDKDTFKSTYQILDELAAKWQDLTDIQQASITELIAGKRQGNIVSALMSNFDTARRATETAVNSTGSALKEQEEYEKGIEYSLKRLEAVFQAFANHILDSSFVKGIVDFGSSTIEVIDKVTSKLGSLGTVGAISGLLMNKNGSGERTMFQW